MAWYRAAVDEPASARGAEMAQRVLRYNEDDVLATLAVRRWVNEHRAELPTVADLSGDAAAGPALSRPARPSPGSRCAGCRAATRPAVGVRRACWGRSCNRRWPACDPLERFAAAVRGSRRCAGSSGQR